MHAYDLSTIAENEIVVKTAKAGEKFVTLDGDVYKRQVVCGAMFGDNLSMISDTTIAAVKTQGCETVSYTHLISWSKIHCKIL